MTQSIDFYFSFRSPYSYLAAQSAGAIADDFDVRLHLRPVLPLAIREPEFFRSANRDRVRYILIDWTRRAEMLGLPHAWPDPDPVVQDLATFAVADEQPHIHRLSRLGVEAERRGRGITFAAAVSRLIFGGTADWDQGEHLSNAAASAGLDLAEMEHAIDAGAEDTDTSHGAEIAANQRAQLDAGHSGVPLFVYNGEPFFGQDRMDTLRWRLGKDGLG